MTEDSWGSRRPHVARVRGCVPPRPCVLGRKREALHRRWYDLGLRFARRFRGGLEQRREAYTTKAAISHGHQVFGWRRLAALKATNEHHPSMVATRYSGQVKGTGLVGPPPTARIESWNYMFLERKFVTGGGPLAQSRLGSVLPNADWSLVPPTIHDIVNNIQILLRSRRGYDHIFRDFGLSPVTGWHNVPEALERLNVELPETLCRYEPRFVMAKLELDVTDEGLKLMVLSGLIKDEGSLLRLIFEAERRHVVQVDFQAFTLKA